MVKFILFLSLLFILSITSFAQNVPGVLTATEKEQVIDSINKRLADYYIFPDVAKKMAGVISSNLTTGVYNKINDPLDFANKLTGDLVAVSNDKHFHVFFDPEWISESKKALTKGDSLALSAKEFPNAKKENFGFKEVKILEGNIGYLKLSNFWNPLYGGETAVAAMNFLANTNAIIIDLRDNGGGYGEMVQLLSSYFFDADPLLLLDIYYRKENKTIQNYTLPYVPGKRRPDVDMYILTNKQTFSAAESFTYIFKNRKRAIIIGETTGGGAHLIDHKAATDRFSLYVPIGRPIDPITKTDWEVTGVKPDIEVTSNDALFTAHIKALEKQATANTDSSTNFPWVLAGVKAKRQPVNIDAAVLKSYAGTFGERKLLFENGNLFYQRNEGQKYKLVPMAADLFMIEEINYLRLQPIVENGKVTGLTRLYDDGTSRKDKKEIIK